MSYLDQDMPADADCRRLDLQLHFDGGSIIVIRFLIVFLIWTKVVYILNEGECWHGV
jgi:hypothetical protein